MNHEKPPDKERGLEMSEDVCAKCGAHIGFGAAFLHLGICDTCSEEDEDDSK